MLDGFGDAPFGMAPFGGPLPGSARRVGHEWTAFARTPDNGLGLELPISSVQIVRRWLGVDSAIVKTPLSPARLAALQPSCGVVVFRDGVREVEGLVDDLNPVFDAESANDVLTVKVVGDAQHLADRLAFPDPLRAADDQTVNDYWTYTGAASTAMWQLISDQAGPTCHPGRQVPGLTMGANPGVGVARQWTSLFGSVLDELRTMSVASGENLGIRMVSGPSTLRADIVKPRDLADTVVFSTDLGNLPGVDLHLGSPKVTDALSAGQGDLHLRLRKYVATTDPAALAWGRRIWSYIDRRDTADVDELLKADQDEIADGGPTVSLALTLLDTDAATYRRDWDLGDHATALVGRPGQPKTTVSDVIREVAIEVDKDGAEKIRPAIGSYDAKAVIPTPTQQTLARALPALAGLIARK